MLSDPLLAAEALTYCGLPLDDSEPAQDTFVFLVPILLIAFALCIRTKRLHSAAWYAIALLSFWALRFFAFAPDCPGRVLF